MTEAHPPGAHLTGKWQGYERDAEISFDTLHSFGTWDGLRDESPLCYGVSIVRCREAYHRTKGDR